MKSFIGIEEWRDIAGYEGYYQVSNYGKVRSVDFSFENGKAKYIKRRILKQETLRDYLRVGLSKDSIHKHFQVHRLVAMTFPDLVDWTEDAKGKPFEEIQVNHKNECKWDNAVWNLEWCDADYNTHYGTAIERRANKQKKTMSTIKPVKQYTKDGQFIAEYLSIREAARQTGIDFTYISACCRKYRNQITAGGYIWKYA